jgi:predicted lipase
MKWLYLLFRGNKCRHKWQIIKTTDVYEYSESPLVVSPLPYATRYTLQCTRCGDVMHRKVGG